MALNTALPIVVALLAVVPCCLAVEPVNTVYADPMQMSLNISEQDATNNSDLQSIHKLLEKQTDYLNKLLAKMERNEELTKTLSKQFDDVLLVKPDEYEKTLKANQFNRRNNNNNQEIPIIKFGKNIVRYGNLLQTVVMSDFTKNPDQAEKSNKKFSEAKGGLSSTDDDSDCKTTEKKIVSNDTNENDSSPTENSVWCTVSKCIRTFSNICGFDDHIGLAKFNNLCDMLQINCYWNLSEYIFFVYFSLKPFIGL